MDKPFLTFEEQVNKLSKDYNLIIKNKELCIKLLSSISYYDLINGYKDMYMINNKFRGVSIEDLFSTHILNKNIQGTLFKYTTFAENSYKTSLAYIIAKTFGENEKKYLAISNYKMDRNNKKRKKLKKLINRLNKKCKYCKDTPTSHYIQTKNHIPPWILFKNISFSDSADIFYYLEKKEKKEFFKLFPILGETSLNYDDKNKIITTSLKHSRKFRNKIAHNLNFLTYRNSYVDKNINLLYINTLVKLEEKDKILNDVWGMILSIILLLNNDILSLNFLIELSAYLKQAENIIIGNTSLKERYCRITGIPKDYENRIECFIKEYRRKLLF